MDWRFRESRTLFDSRIGEIEREYESFPIIF